MAKVALLQCDNCQDATFKKDESHYRVRGANKTDGKVAVLDFCNDCAGTLFGEAIKDARPRKAREPAAPAKTAPAKQTAAKAS